MPAVTTAIVSGALANKPFNGGNAWSRLSWVLGFQRLGLDVCFVEQIRRGDCVDAAGAPTDFRRSANLAYFRDVMDRFGLAQSSALLCDEGDEGDGLPRAELAARARGAGVLFNISGHLTCPDIREGPRARVYYDDDPGFTQFWHVTGELGARLEGHDFYLTLGENIGHPDCTSPTGNLAWQPTRPPVVLDQWPVCLQPALDRFTTVASWRGAYAPVEHDGTRFGVKVHEFRKVLDMPLRTGQAFEIALQIHPGDQRDLDALRSHQWRIVDPRETAGSPDQFRHYVQTSGAEFSVAQGIYVDTHSGWFSDRTVRYLASGKPALVQDTGFSGHVPVGQGLLAFRTLDEAVEGAARIARDYPQHCRAARRVAEECFSAHTVIRRLAEAIGLELP